MAYKKNTDYQALINDAVSKGDYASASRYEKERNEKIDAEGLSYEKTNNYNVPLGVDGDTYNKSKAPFVQGDSKAKDQMANNAYSNLSNLTNKTSIVSDSTKNKINSNFKVPTAVTEADAWLSSQLEKIQSGKTSFSDQVSDLMNQIMNRDKFSYDVDKDPLFQQALASATNSGKLAMQDTIGQASALTGGYGSTYATTAGNQAYNAFIEDAYDNFPQYYQMAMEAYQMEGDEMYRQLGMLSDADDKEYNRNVTAYDATYNHRNQMWNEAYTQHRDSVNDAFNMANLELNEHGQLVSDAYTLYSAASNEADKMYAREYNMWQDEVNRAMQYVQLLNNNALADRDFNYQKEWTQTQLDNQNYWNQQNLNLDYAKLAQDDKHFRANLNASQSKAAEKLEKDYSLTTTEINEIATTYKDAIAGGKTEDEAIELVAEELVLLGKYTEDEDFTSAMGIFLDGYVTAEQAKANTFDASKLTSKYNIKKMSIDYVYDGQTYSEQDMVNMLDKKGFTKEKIKNILETARKSK